MISELKLQQENTFCACLGASTFVLALLIAFFGGLAATALGAVMHSISIFYNSRGLQLYNGKPMVFKIDVLKVKEGFPEASFSLGALDLLHHLTFRDQWMEKVSRSSNAGGNYGATNHLDLQYHSGQTRTYNVVHLASFIMSNIHLSPIQARFSFNNPEYVTLWTSDQSLLVPQWFKTFRSVTPNQHTSSEWKLIKIRA